MHAALELLLGFPTVVFTTLMLVVLGYWGLVVVGAMGIDLIPFDAEAEGADAGMDVDGDIDVGGGDGLAAALSMGSVPVTVIVSLIVFKAWVASMLAQWLLGPLMGTTLLLVTVGGGVLLVSFLIATWLTTFSARSLRPVFKLHTQHGGKHLLGGRVLITSSRVSENFGTAIYRVPDSAGTELSLNVTCDIANSLAEGSEAVITDFDEASGDYSVRPLHLSSTEPAGAVAHTEPPA